MQRKLEHLFSISNLHYSADQSARFAINRSFYTKQLIKEKTLRFTFLAIKDMPIVQFENYLCDADFSFLSHFLKCVWPQ